MILTRLYYSTQFSNIARVMNRLTLYISYQEYVLYSRDRLPSAFWRYKQSCSRIFCLLSSISSEITETKTTKTFDTSGRPSSHPKPCSTSVLPHTYICQNLPTPLVCSALQQAPRVPLPLTPTLSRSTVHATLAQQMGQTLATRKSEYLGGEVVPWAGIRRGEEVEEWYVQCG
jgi:hypothetical protein